MKYEKDWREDTCEGLKRRKGGRSDLTLFQLKCIFKLWKEEYGSVKELNIYTEESIVTENYLF